MNEDNEKRCAFASENIKGKYKNCKALTVGECDGLKFGCKFYKTKSQLYSQIDKCIGRCRAQGRCENCRYRDIPCRKSYELKNDRMCKN